jgi:very-short-patch-repair endonuclease
MADKGAISVDDRIAAVASRQYGLVTASQLVAAGLGRSAISQRVQAGRLRRCHRGVYAVGHTAPSHRARWLAAALTVGVRAAIAASDAGALWEMLPLPAHPGPVHVIVPGHGGRRRRSGIIVHRSATFAADDVTRRFGIPVTTPARTLADLRRLLPRERFEEALDKARILRLPIGDVGRQEGTRSRLERRFVRLCRRHRLPAPEVNVWVGRFRVDFLWREQRLIVETDGFATHRTRIAFEADRARDVCLKLMGYEVVRFTWRQVTGEPEHVARTIRELLLRRAA